jgi:hypothetical protein
VFFCGKYPSNASWTVNADTLLIDWKNYGTYEFPLKEDNSSLDGYASGKPENWRNLEYLRDFNDGEKLLLGDGFGSAWDFQYEKGHFEVRFQCDGFNHFVCPQYPAHSHWSMDEETGDILVNWGSYGDYELHVEAETGDLVGNKKGQPSNWRRAKLLRALTAEDVAAAAAAHDHSHNHVHSADCKH